MTVFTTTEFKPKEATREEWAQYHDFRRAIHEEISPEDPITPDDQEEISAKRDDPFGQEKRFGIYAEGRLVAGFGAGSPTPKAPGYESNKQYIWGGGAVRKEYRRKGLGTRCLQGMFDLMKEWDKTVFTTWVDHETGHGFMQAIGAAEKSKFADNRLDFRKIDWDMVDRWIEDGKMRSPDAKLELFEDRVPEDFLEEYTPILSELVMTMPFDDMDHGDIVITPETFKERQARRDELGIEIHTLIVRSPEGRLLGMTDVEWNPAKPNYVDQRFTGVHPDARGSGLGKLLKAFMLNFLRTRYDDIHWIITGNAQSNDPMLAINKALGFKQHKPASIYQIERDQIEAYLSSRS